jgi:phage FluMu protein Com
MRNKQITLCDASFAIAKDMTNFSAWVRQNLIEFAKQQTPHVKTIRCHECQNLLDLQWDTTYQEYYGRCIQCQHNDELSDDDGYRTFTPKWVVQNGE